MDASDRNPGSTPDETATESSENDPQDDRLTGRLDHLPLSRRGTLLSLIGLGSVGVGLTSEPAAAQQRPWQTDVDANGHRLFDLGALEMINNPTFGTTDNTALEGVVNKERFLQVIPTPTGVGANLVAGHLSNSVGQSVLGATIAGGGNSTGPNEITANYGFVGGGQNNTASGERTVVAGGDNNTASGELAIVGGGLANDATGLLTTVAGGISNAARAERATVAGGEGNIVREPYGTIGGGRTNEITGQTATVAGGKSNAARAERATVAGGDSNVVRDAYGTIGGGRNNEAGRQGDDIPPEKAPDATVSGGRNNKAVGKEATVGGGRNNEAVGRHTSVGGGKGNLATGTLVSGPRNAATVGGGEGNSSTGWQTTIAGGKGNRASSRHATVAGGKNNKATFRKATVGGGVGNKAEGQWTTIGGGAGNKADGSGATVAGGADNKATATAATVGGGVNNKAVDNATVAGGDSNTASGGAAMVPGGRANTALGSVSFAGGTRARAESKGTFVWNDNSTYHNLPGEEIDGLSSGKDIAGSGVTGRNTFHASAQRGFRFITGPDSVTYISGGSTGWSTTSTRAAKTNIDPVDPQTVLDGIEAIEVATWEYKDEDGNGQGVRHMGPMAEDFHAAFDVGANDSGINSINADGVAFAAIQGVAERLNEETTNRRDALAEKDARIQELEAENDQLRERLSAVEDRLASLEAGQQSARRADD